MSPYGTFDNISGAGIRCSGKTFEETLVSAANALIYLIADLEKILKEKDGLLIGFDLKADNREDLFLKWVREIHFNFYAKQFILADIKFYGLTEKKFEVRARAIPFDPDLYGRPVKIKAVRSQGFKLERIKGGWQAEVLLDL